MGTRKFALFPKVRGAGSIFTCADMGFYVFKTIPAIAIGIDSEEF
jgi:hypothetical protein